MTGEAREFAVRGLQAAALNTAIAAALTLTGNHGFGVNLLYSQCIGLIIWAVIDFGGHWWIPDRATQWRRYALLVPAAVAVGYFGGSLLADAMLGYSTLNFWLSSPARGLGFLLVSSTAGGVVTYFYLSRARLQAAQQQAQALQQLATETRLKLLETQLEPHMLFNTLANLRVLIGVDPARAQVMLDHMIAYLRATLNASRAASHPLADEFARLDDYLALMAVRMGPRLQYRLVLPPELAQQPVPTLLLQPLVENAIKHGLEPKVDGGTITVQAHAEGATLCLQVADTGVGLREPQGADDPAHATPSTTNAPADGTGFGLHQVRERLAAAYGGAASVTLQPQATGGVCVVLRLPTTVATPPAVAP